MMQSCYALYFNIIYLLQRFLLRIIIYLKTLFWFSMLLNTIEQRIAPEYEKQLEESCDKQLTILEVFHKKIIDETSINLNYAYECTYDWQDLLSKAYAFGIHRHIGILWSYAEKSIQTIPLTVMRRPMFSKTSLKLQQMSRSIY